MDIDIDAAADLIGNDLGFGTPDPKNDDDLGMGDTGNENPIPQSTSTDGTNPPTTTGDNATTNAAPPKAEGTDSATTAEGTPPAATTVVEAPRTWRPEAAAEWAKIPPTVQQEILKREEDMFRGLENYKAEAGLGKAFRSVTQPYDAILRANNLDPIVLTQNLMNAHYKLATGSHEDKVQLFLELAQNYRVDLATLQESAPVQPYVDPEVSRLRQEFQKVQSELNQGKLQQQQAQRNQIQMEIDAFASDPKNEHFNLVANDIVTLMRSGEVRDLKEAYDKAVYLNPVTRAKELAKVEAEAIRKAKEAQAQQVQAAKSAMTGNVRTTAKTASGTTTLGSIDDTLRETMAEIKARG